MYSEDITTCVRISGERAAIANFCEYYFEVIPSDNDLASAEWVHLSPPRNLRSWVTTLLVRRNIFDCAQSDIEAWIATDDGLPSDVYKFARRRGLSACAYYKNDDCTRMGWFTDFEDREYARFPDYEDVIRTMGIYAFTSVFDVADIWELTDEEYGSF